MPRWCGWDLCAVGQVLMVALPVEAVLLYLRVRYHAAAAEGRIWRTLRGAVLTSLLRYRRSMAGTTVLKNKE